MRIHARLATLAGLALIVIAATAAPADARPAPTSETITIDFAGAPGQTGTVRASGAVNDIGTLTPTDGDTDTLVFPDGTLALQLTVTTTVHYPRPPLCITTFHSTGSYTIVGGTWRFAGAAGTGAASDSGFTIGPSQDCSAAPGLVVDHGTVRGELVLPSRPRSSG